MERARPASSRGPDRTQEITMAFDYLAGGALAVLLTGYLVYALLRPERF